VTTWPAAGSYFLYIDKITINDLNYTMDLGEDMNYTLGGPGSGLLCQRGLGWEGEEARPGYRHHSLG
jgi:hypothetical protein